MHTQSFMYIIVVKRQREREREPLLLLDLFSLLFTKRMAHSTRRARCALNTDEATSFVFFPSTGLPFCFSVCFVLFFQGRKRREKKRVLPTMTVINRSISQNETGAHTRFSSLLIFLYTAVADCFTIVFRCHRSARRQISFFRR